MRFIAWRISDSGMMCVLTFYFLLLNVSFTGRRVCIVLLKQPLLPSLPAPITLDFLAHWRFGSGNRRQALWNTSPPLLAQHRPTMAHHCIPPSSYFRSPTAFDSFYFQSAKHGNNIQAPPPDAARPHYLRHWMRLFLSCPSKRSPLFSLLPLILLSSLWLTRSHSAPTNLWPNN